MGRLIEFLQEKDNVAVLFDDKDGEKILMKLGTQVVEDFERDDDSMLDWKEMVRNGLKLAAQDTRGKSEPWDNATNFKSPAIMEASITFGDRALTELLRGRNILKADVIGADPQQEKKQSAENVVEFMNWQLTYEMKDWRPTQQKLFYELPPVGALFKKVFFDSIDRINKSELIHYPDFVINQSASSLEEATFTHPMDFSQDEVLERQKAGLWLDVNIYPEDADGDEGSNAEQEEIHAIDNPEQFLEQNCWFDLDEDDYREPYTVTVHKNSRQVVRIVPRYGVNDIFVKDKTDVIRSLEQEDLENQNSIKLVRIKPKPNLVYYEFIPSFDGTFLGLGYYHLLSSLTKANNNLTNMLTDAGVLANLQGGFLAKGFRKRMGELRMKPGSWQSTDISAQDLQNGIFPFPFKEPSTVLFQLNEKLEERANKLTANTDLKGLLAPNAPAATTLALIQETMLPTSAILQRVIGAESKEFMLLFLLDAEFTDPVVYREILDNPEADFRQDFNIDRMDVLPTANPEMSSRMQRLQRAQVLMDPNQLQIITMSGGDIRPILNNWFDAIGAEEMINEVYPSKEEMTEEQQARIEAQQQQAQQQAQLLDIQVEHAERRIELDELDKQSMAAERASKIRLNLMNMQKIESETILNLEKAESEQVKNQIDTYTAQLTGIRDAIKATETDIKFDNDERDRELKREANNVTRLPAATSR